ncbi:phage baseplate assembly protein V [Nonomuraea sp. NPDC002799]
MSTLFERSAGQEEGGRGPAASIASATVVNNLDLVMEGKVLVRVPALGQEVWARLTAPGAGNGAGVFYVPRVGDEVLVAMAGNDPTDTFVLGGLWNARDRIPVSDPVTAQSTRVVRSGMTAGTGHEIVMDDLVQSVKVSTSTGQKIIMDPTKIEITNLAGTVRIILDNATQKVSITSAAAIELKAPKISLEGAAVEINGAATTTVKSGGVCNVTAPLVKIN